MEQVIKETIVAVTKCIKVDTLYIDKSDFCNVQNIWLGPNNFNKAQC